MTQSSPVDRRAATLAPQVAEVADSCKSLSVGDASNWNTGRVQPILPPMNDKPHRKHAADREPPMPSEAELLASLARSEAELAAGHIVSGDEVLRELDESIARTEAKRAGRKPHRTAIRR